MSEFEQKELPAVVAHALHFSGVPARWLELEVTESTVMRDPQRTVAMLHELKQIGVHLALDDFDTGYSSLSYLRRFPIDALRFDQSFVRDITTDPDDAAIEVAMRCCASTSVTPFCIGRQHKRAPSRHARVTNVAA